MSDLRLQIYHRLPAPLRSVAASLRGYYLNSWRYGAESEQLIAAAQEREQWSAAQWQAWQQERLARVLHRAATQVPFYREQWAERRRRGDQASWEELQNWPVLPKDAVRNHPTAFVADGCDRRQMYHEQTSGTTGKPMQVWWSRAAVRAWFALYELRNRRWHGVNRRQNWAILGGQAVVPAHVQRPPFWVWNLPMRQLYLSSNHISRQNLPAFIEALRRYEITHMITYSSSAAQLAREALAQNLVPQGLQVVITNAEPLLPWQRTTIQQGLGCPARETYGQAEIVTAASECPHGRLHLWPEVGCTEVLADDADTPQTSGQTGRLICTSLLNEDMPLVRYAVGDRGRLATENPGAAATEACACGRTLPLIEEIEGRSNDLLQTRDGRFVYWINPVFYSLPVREAQVIQESLDLLRVLYVPAPEFTAATAQTIRERLQARLGALEIRLEAVPEIPRGANGKFRAVVSRLTAPQPKP